ncbi:hypothetical protein OSTOST_24755, partial [Ostertagia ostertagi]
RPGSEAGYGSELGGGAGSGRNSRADALSPTGIDPLGKTDPYGKGPVGPYGGTGLPSGYGSPGLHGSGIPGGGGYGGSPVAPGHGAGADNGSGYPGEPGGGRHGAGVGSPRGHPHSTLDSHPYGSNGILGPGNDGRMSAASSMFSDPSYRFDTKTGYLITNPRELIHQYATTTPVAVMEATDHTPVTTTISKHSTYRKTEETTEERFSPYAPYKTVRNVQSPTKFTQQLRDETMTRTQREANTHADPLNQRDSQAQQKINEIRSKTHNIRRGHDEIDDLTQQLLQGLNTSSRI